VSTLIGQEAEESAAQWLQHTKKWKLVETNWKLPSVEIDVIMKYKKSLHFIEVKYRSSLYSGDGFSAVTIGKFNRLKRGAQLYLAEYPWKGTVQIDVVAVTGQLGALNFELIENVTV